MKKIFYAVLKRYMQLVARIYFGKVEIVGKENIPVGKPIIYSCNHQNAFLDALLVGAFSPVKITSLTRSDVFGSHAGMWFMNAAQMEPIYRMQDGIDKLALNEKTFQRVRDRLRANEGVLIFSEGNHGNEYYLRPLSKGSSRMALESQEKMMDKDVQVVPVGLNYFHHQRPLHKLVLAFGEPIAVKDYLDEYQVHAARATNQLKRSITEGMRRVLMIPDHSDEYEARKSFINHRNENFDFQEFRERLSQGDAALKASRKRNELLFNLGRLLGVFNFLPLLVLDMVCRKVKDIVFHASFKWVTALFVFPIWWLLTFGIATLFWNWETGLQVVGIQFMALILRQYLIRWSNPPH
jgi:1-acyl-sn-glycerol-3-phosphate acyltransferase